MKHCTSSAYGTLLLSVVLASAAKAQEQDFTFATNNNTLTITRYIGTNAAPTVPSSVDGLPVVTIGNMAFYGNTNITTVALSNTITNIGQSAFFNCALLSTITIPDSVLSIGRGSFGACTNLTNIVIGSGLTDIPFINAFAECSSLMAITVSASNPAFTSTNGVMFDKTKTTLLRFPQALSGSYQIPTSVKAVGINAFSECQHLTFIGLPTGLASIAGDAFGLCSSLTNITIPFSVTNIGGIPFYYCSNLLAITVEEANSNYSSLDGILFDKTQSTLIECPAGRGGSYPVPDTVTNVSDFAFADCSRLQQILIGKGIRSLLDGNFIGCTSLTNVVLPMEMSTIGYQVFADCPNLDGIVLPNALSSIGLWAFISCAKLTNITIPAYVTNVALGAFSDCRNLQGIFFQGNAPAVYPNGSISENGTVYYLPGTSGWTNAYAGRPAVLWNPKLRIYTQWMDAMYIQVMGTTNIPVVLESATEATQPIWEMMGSASIGPAGWTTFEDIYWTHFPTRIFRVRSP